MEQIPSLETNCFSASQEIPRVLCNKPVNYVLSPWSRFLLEKLTVSQLVKKFPTFCGTRINLGNPECIQSCVRNGIVYLRCVCVCVCVCGLVR